MAAHHPNLTARRVQQARALGDWSQAALAAETGISIEDVAAIEAGTVAPTADQLDLIARATRLDVASFLPGGGDVPPHHAPPPTP